MLAPIENRGRFAVEVISAVRAAVGPDFPIILRWSQWKQQDYTARLAVTQEELERFLMPLSDAGSIYSIAHRDASGSPNLKAVN